MEPQLQLQVFAGTLMPEALAQAYGGHSPSASQLCLPQAETVPISTLGYNLILGRWDLRWFKFDMLDNGNDM